MNKREIAIFLAEALNESGHDTGRDVAAEIKEINGDFIIKYYERKDDGKVVCYAINVGGGFQVELKK